MADMLKAVQMAREKGGKKPFTYDGPWEGLENAVEKYQQDKQGTEVPEKDEEEEHKLNDLAPANPEAEGDRGIASEGHPGMGKFTSMIEAVKQMIQQREQPEEEGNLEDLRNKALQEQEIEDFAQKRRMQNPEPEGEASNLPRVLPKKKGFSKSDVWGKTLANSPTGLRSRIK